ncbi:hypothetical protein BML2526_25650 [Providencia rettgeri]|uniref:hypothetical protein n=1 Tax=Providencia rettgeri TaxID=587 RepID=UPI0013745DDF|nr:hypothetical protein BML2526_25650 [Providencia rettgeri]BBV11991.1 hypothetical protein BML2576_14500 [Providencia rettgeri]BDH18119.1 hypothetical protein PrNR1418_14100 [Providencia rettgeri]
MMISVNLSKESPPETPISGVVTTVELALLELTDSSQPCGCSAAATIDSARYGTAFNRCA